MPASPFVSLIVPAYNCGWHLRECLASLLAQDYPYFEVILVDNASTDDTAEVCRELPAVRYVYFDRARSSYAARNEGVRVARGEVLAFFDADQNARPDYLRLLLEEYVPGDPNHVFVGRLQDDPRVPRLLREFFSWSGAKIEFDSGRIATAAVAVPRTLFEELGGFRSDMLSGGDVQFFHRAVRRARVHVSREVIGNHYWTRSVRQYLAKEARYQFGHGHLARAEGRRPPSCTKAAGRVFWAFGVKGLAAVLVPWRYPVRQWGIRWQAQAIGVLTAVYRLGGIVQFKLGCRRAGDLPADIGRPRPCRSGRA